jgi:predicted dehydrogenase
LSVAAPIPLAVVGAGAIGRMHVERILGTPGAMLAGVADTSPEGRRWCLERGISCWDDVASMLGAARPGGVIVATPNATHVAIAGECLRRGLPVLVEKPLSDQLESGAELVRMERESGVPVLVGHHRRHNPVVRRARDWIAEGRLGTVVSAVAMAASFKPASYFEPDWRRERGGGPVLINLIHDVDMLLYLLGPVRSVQAMASHRIRKLPVEDTAVAMLEFEAGALATLAVSDTAVAPWNWDLCAGEQPQYPRQPVQSHFLLGDHGSLSLPDVSSWRYSGDRHWHAELHREQVVPHERSPYQLQLEHYLEVIEGRQQPLCDALEGWRTLEVAIAIGEAARTRAPVSCSGHPASWGATHSMT